MNSIDKSDKSVKGYNPDWSTLLGLEISKGEVKHLTGLSLNNIPLHKPSALRKAISERRIALEILSASLIPIYFAGGLAFITILMSLILNNIGELVFPIHFKDISVRDILYFINVFFYWMPATIITIPIYRKIRQIVLNKATTPKTTIPLLEEVSKYNRVAKTVEVQNQLEVAGNPVVLNNREKVVEALRLTRADLVRALKTEKILRENKNIINSKPELFENNLAALRALEISELATESGQLINETLQVATGVQEEMKKLQNWRLR